jgi:hypothetical protein
MAVAAQGMAKAAELLARHLTLVATNVPFLGRGKQDAARAVTESGKDAVDPVAGYGRIHDALARLQDFVSGNARRIHGLQVPAKHVTLTHGHWTVPAQYGSGECSVIPMHAGQTLPWRIEEISA